MPRLRNRCSCYRKSMLLRAWIAACAAALAVSSATESTAAPPQDPAPAPAAKSGCFVAGDGYLRARLRGALESGSQLERRADAMRGRAAALGEWRTREHRRTRARRGPAHPHRIRHRRHFRRNRRKSAAHQRHDSLRRRAARVRHAGRRQVHRGFAHPAARGVARRETPLSIAWKPAVSASGRPPASRAKSGFS